MRVRFDGLLAGPRLTELAIPFVAVFASNAAVVRADIPLGTRLLLHALAIHAAFQRPATLFGALLPFSTDTRALSTGEREIRELRFAHIFAQDATLERVATDEIAARLVRC